MKINSICILGGGTSGFATASVLAKYRQTSGLKFDIKVVYSENVGTIGVGESTLFAFNLLLKYLDLKDSDWMKECNATYKTSIRFENFYKKGTFFHYPFGTSDPHDTAGKLVDWHILKTLYPDIFTQETAAQFFLPQTLLSERNKIDTDETYLDKNAAYHFDSKLLGEFLKKYSKERGVEVIDDTFYGTEQDKYGNIESIVCDNGTYRADLFVDCSVFNSLLLGKTMSEEYIPFDKTLINNKSLAVKVPYKNKEKQLKNYTNCVALDNGWVWEIPLWDSLAYGYVHTNRFASEKEIEQELFDHIGKEVDYKTVNFKTGRYKRGWVKNVVAIGLSYGFIEPIESTGIATTVSNIFGLLEYLSKRDMTVTRVDKDNFNHSIGTDIDRFRGFVEMHYYLSSRDDSPYWRYVTEDVDYYWSDAFNVGYKQFMALCTDIRNFNADTVRELGPGGYNGIVFVALGMNYGSYSPAMIVAEGHNYEECKDHYLKYWKDLEKSIKKLPSSYQFLLKNVYNK